MPYAPKFYFEDLGDAAPARLEEEFLRITEGIYPTVVEIMKRESYDPLIIGSSHDFAWDFPKLVKISLGEVSPAELKVGLEVLPQQLGWLKDYLRDAKEYCEKGTIQGEVPSTETIGHLTAYPRKLSNTERGTIQCLEAGMDVVATEHDHSRAWINEDHLNLLVEKEESVWAGGMAWHELQPGYSSIRREIHSLGVLEHERPDVIIVGMYHALKYDLLLGRDGASCHIYSTQPLRWNPTLRMWREVHNLHRRKASRPA